MGSTLGFAQNLITNGTFDDATGWTVVNQYGIESTNGSVAITGGEVNIGKIDPTNGGWIHMGLYTSVNLTAGWYQFDMDMTFDGIDQIWGEVYIGSVQPVDNAEYNGDQQVIKAYHAWDCVKTYTGSAVAAGCDTSNPGKFQITTGGTYYLLFRTGGGTFGASGITLDNWSLVSADPPPAPITDLTVDFETATEFGAADGGTYTDLVANTVTDGINSSAFVGQISDCNATWWTHAFLNTTGFDLSSGDRGFSLMVKGDRVTPIMLKLQVGADYNANHEIFGQEYTTPGVWQKITWDLSSYTTSDRTRLVLFFDIQSNNNTGGSTDTFQFDNLVFGEYATLSSKDFTIEGLAIYPNPTIDTWNISTKSQAINSIEVFNILGKRVLALRPIGLSAEVDASNLNPGIYIAKISTELGTQTKKLIKN